MDSRQISHRISHCHDIFLCTAVRAMRFLCEYIAFKFLQCETISGIAKLQSFSNKNLFVNPAARGHFSGYVRLPKNLSTSPCCDFCVAHRYRKINKDRRAVSCESSEGIDSGFTGLLHFSDVSRLQPSLLRMRLMRLRTFQF
jgi:hypothetical protein